MSYSKRNKVRRNFSRRLDKRTCINKRDFSKEVSRVAIRNLNRKKDGALYYAYKCPMCGKYHISKTVDRGME